MNLVYALGGGLGHLTRARALLHTLGIEGPVTVLVPSLRTADPRALGDWTPLVIPEATVRDAAALREWILRQIEMLAPRTFYVDAFPGGVLGELCDLPPLGIPLVHCARLLRWPAYGARLRDELPRYARTYRSEPIDGEQASLLARISDAVEPIALRDPPAEATFALDGDASWELIVHSGPDDEILALVRYADELGWSGAAPRRRLVISPRRPAALSLTVQHADLYPAWPLFSAAARIVTACGANAMRQTELHAARHRFLPFPRPLDDQLRRAGRRASEGHALADFLTRLAERGGERRSREEIDREIAEERESWGS